MEYRFRRISPYGTIDVDGIYIINQKGFDSTLEYEFIHYSNCKFFHVEQNQVVYKFDFLKSTNWREKWLINFRQLEWISQLKWEKFVSKTRKFPSQNYTSRYRILTEFYSKWHKDLNIISC